MNNDTPRLVLNSKMPSLWVRQRLYSKDNDFFVYNELCTIVYLHNGVQTVPSTW